MVLLPADSKRVFLPPKDTPVKESTSNSGTYNLDTRSICTIIIKKPDYAIFQTKTHIEIKLLERHFIKSTQTADKQNQ